jgi:hypothetical protein
MKCVLASGITCLSFLGLIWKLGAGRGLIPAYRIALNRYFAWPRTVGATLAITQHICQS